MSDVHHTTVLELVAVLCAAEDMGDEIVALNVDTGIYFSMRDVSAALWRDLVAGYPLERLSACVREATGSDEGVRTFADEMLRHGLLRPATRAPADGEPTIVALLASGVREVNLEIYEDMKDLILSDPIHDVDEAVGWPRPSASPR